MTTALTLSPGERIVFQTHRKRAWYDILGSILLTLFIFLAFAIFNGMLRQAALNSPYGYQPGLPDFLVAFLPFVILLSGISDVISRLVCEFTLTNRRIVVKGWPNPWTHYEMPLDQVERLTSTLGGIRIKQKNRVLRKAVQMANKWEFINAYNDVIRGDIYPWPSVSVPPTSMKPASQVQPASPPPMAKPVLVQPKPMPESVKLPREVNVTTAFNLQPGEQIIFQTRRKHGWYDLMGNILLWLVVLFLFGLLYAFLFPGMVGLITMGILGPILIWKVIEDVISRLISETTLTNERILVRGMPYIWTRLELPLDRVENVTRGVGGSVRVEQQWQQKPRAISTPDREGFLLAYDNLVRRDGASIPAVSVPAPASPPAPVQPRPMTIGPTETPVQKPAKAVEVELAPVPLKAEEGTIPAGPQKLKAWMVIMIPTLVIGVAVGLMYAEKSLSTVFGSPVTATRVPARAPNDAATQQAKNSRATATAQYAWTNTFAAPILFQTNLHAPNFEDDFITTSGRFVRWNSITESGVTFADGVMRMKGSDWHGAGGSMIATDFVISFDVKPINIGSGSGFAVNFRSGNNQWYNFGCNFYDDWCGMMVFLEGEEETGVSDRMSGTDPEQRRNILVIAQGNEFGFYINEVPFAYVRDNRLHGDWIDIGLWSSPGESEIEFDNVKFWDLNNLR